MTQSLIIRAETEQDISTAFEWYENEEEGLGNEFLSALEDALDQIADAPYTYQIVIGSTRRCILKRFPYSVFFTVIDNSIVVTACVHHKRHPKIWRSRR